MQKPLVLKSDKKEATIGRIATKKNWEISRFANTGILKFKDKNFHVIDQK
jgi:hypothetical protein